MTRAVIARAALLMTTMGMVAPACEEKASRTLEPPASAAAVPAPGGLRRLLRRQYINSVRVLLGEAAAQAAMPPEDTSLHGFDSIAAAELSLPPSAVGAYEISARAVAQAAIRDPGRIAQILPCTPTGPADAQCHRQFVASFGRLAWRRPLNRAEIDRISAVAQAAAAAYADFSTGLAYAISALLQSPNFLYLIEIGEPDTKNPAVRRLTNRELLARVSFVLLDQTPDERLLDMASGRELEAADVRSLARDLLLRPEAKAALSAFYGELFRIRGIENISKDRTLFPRFNAKLAQAMKEETLRLIDDIVWAHNADARELLTADYTFVNAELAALYEVPVPSSGGFSKVLLPLEQMRSGLLSTSAFLARFAHPDRTSPTRRGLFIRTALLCEEIPPPPPGIDASLPRSSSSISLKAQLQHHMEDPMCSSCHALIDPIGLTLENYNAIGAFRTKDNGFPIDPSVDGESDVGSFASARDLGALLHDDPRIPRCMVKNLLRSALGHLDRSGQQPAIDALHEAFAASGYKMRELLVELVASPAFLLVSDPK
jgi:hypothetical protein